MGRKKEPPRVAVRLTESEKKKIEAAAAKCGLPPGEKRDAIMYCLCLCVWYNYIRAYGCVDVKRKAHFFAN